MIDQELRRAVGPLEQADLLAGAEQLEATYEPGLHTRAIRLRILAEDINEGRVEIKSLEPLP